MSAIANSLPRPIIDELVRAALLEDLGRAGDVTSQACLRPDAKAEAVIRARVPGTLAGLPFAESAFRQIGEGLRFAPKTGDGDRLQPGDEVATIEGPALLLLSAERVGLNFLTHLSGIATATRTFADAIAHTNAKVTCTRKTLPGLRAAQKYAVRAGGGSNHRFGLDDAILIKDNHIAVCGGVVEAVQAAKAYAGHLMAIEVEVDTLDQFALILELLDRQRPDVVMLDNMDPATLAEGVAMNNEASGKPVTLEASGGITLDTIASVAESGVDYISSGWLTSSAPSLDLGLDIDIA
ncbi:MAG: carboxylating nicotinate-nucleotide diphosphorylase [Rhizobiales bacterium]|nr:carboxylating nicotinate-nucleotide diphosphorylase [Hyphomicrobiales bacterium]MBO6700413.1 carboxylating nicotinate-nucleotide diphosphorylase [Hyphomicrobiales bacterium]MBO6737949.1 carboxylating nicotinate-nucleotide diphosphorylase [Hyphomicrobiales bacterium]MBO6913744.1 carboxylating nicotinate-nucleotide diphosphorylase [Hyphomicrobiales bacterium]MBO6954361.1 carboxylating nicotinate-nucleotide diphosphorylase [Hyphomicrobiales bacterium]